MLPVVLPAVVLVFFIDNIRYTTPFPLSLSHYNHVFLVDDDRRQSEKGAEYDLPNESFWQQYLLSLFLLPNLKRSKNLLYTNYSRFLSTRSGTIE